MKKPSAPPSGTPVSGLPLEDGAKTAPVLPPSGGSWTVMPDGTLRRDHGTEFAEPSNAAKAAVEAPLNKD